MTRFNIDVELNNCIIACADDCLLFNKINDYFL